MLLRRALFRLGLRYRNSPHSLVGKPDIVFKRKRLAVFVDGDFWHGKDWGARQAKLRKGANPEYWITKIEANRARDVRNNDLLIEQGWTVVRVWESDIRRDAETAAARIASILATRD